MLTLGMYDIERSVKPSKLRLRENVSLETVNTLANVTRRCYQFGDSGVRFPLRSRWTQVLSTSRVYRTHWSARLSEGARVPQ